MIVDMITDLDARLIYLTIESKIKITRSLIKVSMKYSIFNFNK